MCVSVIYCRERKKGDVSMWCELLARNCASSHGYPDSQTAGGGRWCVCVFVLLCVCVGTVWCVGGSNLLSLMAWLAMLPFVLF